MSLIESETMRGNQARLYDLAASIWTQNPPQTPSEWGAANRVYPPTTGLPGPRNPWLTPYMVAFSDAMGEGGVFRGIRYSRVCAVMGAQMGKTEGILDVMGSRLDQRPAPILYVGPGADFNRDQFEPRFMSLLDEAPLLAAKVVRGRRMKKTLKRVAGVPVRLAHAGSSTALKSDPAAMALVDEYDEMMGSVRGQGDVLGLVEARGDTYADFVTGVTSTPSKGLVVPEIDENSGLAFWAKAEPADVESPIWQLWQEGTRHHFCWPCTQCHEYFVPRLDTVHWPKGATPARAKAEAHFMCPRCGGVMTEEDKKWMNDRGAMVAPGETVALVNDEPEISGRPEETATLSFWTSGLCSPFVSVGVRVERYLTALASGDPHKIQTAKNANFGQVHAMHDGGDLLEWEEVLEKRRLPYRRGTVPEQAFRLVGAVDVQKFSLWFVVRAFGARGTSWLVDYGQLFGPTDQPEVWDSLTDVLLTPIGGWQIERVMVDSGFRPNKVAPGEEHMVYSYIRKFPWLCQATKGKDVQAQPYRVSKTEVAKDGSKLKRSIDLVWLSSDFFKSLVMSRLSIPVDQPGALLLPEDTDEDYAQQLVSETRMVLDGKPTWVRVRKDNHLLDCEAMAAAAAYSLNVQRIPDATESQPAEAARAALAEQGRAAAPAPSSKPEPAEADASAAALDFRSRFKGRGQRLNRR